MGYLHINNLYKEQDILLFKECYWLEKIHGTSAHLKWKDGVLSFYSGGESHPKFVSLFDVPKLEESFRALGYNDVVVYGEAYGGSQQKMANTYGPHLRFIVFDIAIDGLWVTVPNMDNLATKLGLEVVAWGKTSTDLETLDKLKSQPSIQAHRNGMGKDRKAEGIVLRPLIEVRKNNDERIIAKHKTDDFKETAKSRDVVDPAKLLVLHKADEIAMEWVTPMRLSHVLDKIPLPHNMDIVSTVMNNMAEDVVREAKGEIVESKEAIKAIRTRAVHLYKEYIRNSMKANHA